LDFGTKLAEDADNGTSSGRADGRQVLGTLAVKENGLLDFMGRVHWSL
jgi:hypothetical protein